MYTHVCFTDVNKYRSNVGQIGPSSQYVLTSDMNKSRILCPIWNQLDPFWPKSGHPGLFICSVIDFYIIFIVIQNGHTNKKNPLFLFFLDGARFDS